MQVICKHLPFESVAQKKLEPLTRVPYHRLIEKRDQIGMPYIIGIINDRFNTEMDGVRLYKAKGYSPYSGEKINEVFYYTINKGENQLTYLGRSNEQNPASIEFLGRFFDANEGGIEAQRKLGDFYLQKGNDLGALYCFKLVAKRGFRQDVQKFGELALKMAASRYQKKDNAKAIEYYKMALGSGALFPKETVGAIHIKLGDIYLKQGNFVEALHCYELSAKTGLNEGIEKLGNLAIRMGDFWLLNQHIANSIKYYKIALENGAEIPSSRQGIIYSHPGRL